MEQDNENIYTQRTEKISYAEKGRFFKLRNILNTIFIILAIAGMAIYFLWKTSVGGPIIIVAIAIKMIECVLRYLH